MKTVNIYETYYSTNNHVMLHMSKYMKLREWKTSIRTETQE